MNGFIKALFQTDIKPFLHELAPIGTMLWQAVVFCAIILLTGFVVYWGKEEVRAEMEMRRPISMKRIFCRICAGFLKVPLIPRQAQKTVFITAPLFAFVFSLFFFFFIPVSEKYFMHPDVSLLYFLFAASGGIYAFIMGGWSSSSRFGFFGAVRLIAQSLACQPVLAVVFVTILMTAGGSDLQTVMRAQKGLWFIVPHFPLFVLYVMAVDMMLAQAPFGAPKSDRELGGGIYSEYSGALHVLFLFAENILMLLCATVGSILFLGGTLPLFDAGTPEAWLMIKTFLLLFVLTLVRGTFPSWRAENVVNMSFKVCLPFSLAWLTVTAIVLYRIHAGG